MVYRVCLRNERRIVTEVSMNVLAFITIACAFGVGYLIGYELGRNKGFYDARRVALKAIEDEIIRRGGVL